MIYRFKLTYSGTDTTVIEPQGWDTFKSEIKRDFKSHGVIFRYTSGTLKLGFADGRSVLEDAFQAEGFDAAVTLTVDQRATTTAAWVNAFTGNAVMENRELTDMYFSVDFETSTFQQKVINRMDTKVKLGATIDLDGNTLSGAINSSTTSWNDIRLVNKYIADFRVGGSSLSFETYNRSHTTSNGTSVFSHLLVNYEGELEAAFGDVQVITESFNTGQLAANSGDQNFIVNSDNQGTIHVEGSFKYKYHGTLTTDVSAPFMDVHLRAYLRQENSLGAFEARQEVFKKTIAVDTSLSPFDYDTGVLTASFSTDVIVTFPGRRIFLYFETEAETSEGGSVTTTNDANIDIYYSTQPTFSLLKSAANNSVKNYILYEVLERILYIISGENYRLSSGFLGITDIGSPADGCGGLVTITNGFQLRGIDTAPEISLSDVLKAIQAIYGIGYSFENVYGVYKMRVELMEYFYGDGEIVDLGSPVSIKEGDKYKESTFNDLVFNKVEIGYDKYTSDEHYTGDIDDFSTKAEYSLPVTTIKGAYSQISPLITSGRLVQAAFESKSDLTKSFKNDNDNFIVAMVRDSGDLVPENDENFQTLGGFSNSDSATAYNIRFAPVYMFLNHALIVNSTLMGKPVSDIISNTSVDINKSFSALYKTTETCRLGDEQRLTRTSTGNITIENNYIANRLFDPIQHDLTVAMTAAQLTLIINAMENNSDDSTKDYGYLTYRDNAGAVQTGYPLTIIWNPNDEIAEITTLEKADNYGV